MVNYVARAARGAGATTAGNADGPESVHEDARLSRVIVKTESAFEELLIALQHGGLYADRGAWRVQEENARETHGKFQPRFAILYRRGTCRKDLQGAIEKHG